MARLPRLKRRAEFLRIAAKGRKAASPGLVLQALRRRPGEMPESEMIPIRVGFTASRKVGMAVERNRARRRLRAAAEQVLRTQAAPGHDFVLIARPETIRRSYAALIGDLEGALRRVGAAKEAARC